MASTSCPAWLACSSGSPESQSNTALASPTAVSICSRAASRPAPRSASVPSGGSPPLRRGCRRPAPKGTPLEGSRGRYVRWHCRAAAPESSLPDALGRELRCGAGPDAASTRGLSSERAVGGGYLAGAHLGRVAALDDRGVRVQPQERGLGHAGAPDMSWCRWRSERRRRRLWPQGVVLFPDPWRRACRVTSCPR